MQALPDAAFGALRLGSGSGTGSSMQPGARTDRFGKADVKAASPSPIGRLSLRTLLGRRPPDDALAEGEEPAPVGQPVRAAAASQSSANSASEPADTDVIQEQADEIETLRERVRDFERQERRQDYRTEVDPFGMTAPESTHSKDEQARA